MTASTGKADTRGVIAWCLYDWANSSFAAVILTFLFAPYFVGYVAADKITGTEVWGYAVSLSALAVAFLSPILGAIADRAGRRKPWIATFTVMSVVATGALWWVKPDTAFVVIALIAVGVGNFAFEMGQVFYNAMLPEITPRDRLGRVSGWGWGAGYAGGVVCLGFAMVAFVQADVPWFGIPKEDAAHVRAATGLLVACWFAVFSLPLFLLTPDVPRNKIAIGQSVRAGLKALLGTVAKLKDARQVGLFLLARMLYADGLTTLFIAGGIYAEGTFGMTLAEVLLFGIGMNVTAGIGAFLFSWYDDWRGPKQTILISVSSLTVLGAAVLMVESTTWFWILGLALGLFVGPAQSASRSFMARIAPENLRTEMFGLFALSGKATAFVGPAVLAWVTAAFESQRAGMVTILVLFVLGGVLLAFVRDAER